MLMWIVGEFCDEPDALGCRSVEVTEYLPSLSLLLAGTGPVDVLEEETMEYMLGV